jgi:hypothetical protein
VQLKQNSRVSSEVIHTNVAFWMCLPDQERLHPSRLDSGTHLHGWRQRLGRPRVDRMGPVSEKIVFSSQLSSSRCAHFVRTFIRIASCLRRLERFPRIVATDVTAMRVKGDSYENSAQYNYREQLATLLT